MTLSVLTVCSANICRSPAVALLLTHRLHNLDVTASSRGLFAVDRGVLCKSILSGVLPSATTDQFRREHRPQQLVASDIEQADLVLTASQRERAGVIRLVPSARAMTFTFNEAAELCQLAGDQLDVSAASGENLVRGLIAEMNESRGQSGLPEQHHMRSVWAPWRVHRWSSLDVPDAHSVPRFPHGVARERLVASTTLLATHLSAAWTPPSGP
jgi:protein-tyrosine-phosphatase